jgi:3',5'-cyclic AMP phosphodiesterase CpdA
MRAVLVAFLLAQQATSLLLRVKEHKVQRKPVHKFSQMHSSIRLAGAEAEATTVRLLHITDTHACIADDLAPHSSRMCNAYKNTKDENGKDTTPEAQFEKTLKWGCHEDQKVDMILLGGDIVNFPSPKGVQWAMDLIKQNCEGMKMAFTNGNHDWMLEGKAKEDANGRPYDWQRAQNSNGVLKPFFNLAKEDSSTFLHGSTVVRDAVRVIWVDNSNYQVGSDQVKFFAQEMSDSKLPVVLMVHIPLDLGKDEQRPADYVCGHPKWGHESDFLAAMEARPSWPSKNLDSTKEFIKLVEQHSAPKGQLVAVLAGHTHADLTQEVGESFARESHSTEPMVCERAREDKERAECNKEGNGNGAAMEYTTGANLNGAYRLLEISV